MPARQPAYIDSYRSGRLREKAETGRRMMADCRLCPRQCRVDRLSDQTGVCRTGRQAMVSSYSPHFGEEGPLVGEGGSGTIFFTHCNLKCIFCQNYDISHQGHGRQVSDETLARIMLELQQTGCHNINLVSPSHVVPQILSALEFAVPEGLSVPLVYNTGGYDRVETLKLLEGVVDIYMPDFKFWDPQVSAAACDAENYPEVARKALVEMHRQVGDLVVEPNGLASRGLLIRHLVLPGGLAGTRPIMRYIAENVSRHSYVNIMSQYRPCGRAERIEALGTSLKPSEFRTALEIAAEEGILRLDRPGRPFLKP